MKTTDEIKAEAEDPVREWIRQRRRESVRGMSYGDRRRALADEMEEEGLHDYAAEVRADAEESDKIDKKQNRADWFWLFFVVGLIIFGYVIGNLA